jgi:NADH-quinone oxidoreductase subunit C
MDDKQPATPHAATKPPAAAATMAIDPWEDELSAAILRKHGVEVGQFRGQPFVTVRLTELIPLLSWLRDDADFDYLVDLTVVDYPQRAERFELVYMLYSFSKNRRIRVKSAIAEGVDAPSAVAVFNGANWLEREAFDMFGVRFSGHPDLRRMLLPEDWSGFPLRKDHSIVGMDHAWVKRNLGIESGQ